MMTMMVVNVSMMLELCDSEYMSGGKRLYLPRLNTTEQDGFEASDAPSAETAVDWFFGSTV